MAFYLLQLIDEQGVPSVSWTLFFLRGRWAEWIRIARKVRTPQQTGSFGVALVAPDFGSNQFSLVGLWMVATSAVNGELQVVRRP